MGISRLKPGLQWRGFLRCPPGKSVVKKGLIAESIKDIRIFMYKGRKIIVVMPAYNAAKTLRKTYDEVMEQGIVDLVILVDDASRDETSAIAPSLPDTQVFVHERNKGYGGNQKTCYRMALEAGADIVIMVHPDYQYTPKLIPAMAAMIGNDLYPCVLGSQDPGRIRAEGRDAALEVHCQPFSHAGRKYSAGCEAFRVPHRIPCLLPGAAAKPLAGRQLRRLSSSTTRCSRRSSGRVTRSPR